MKYLRCIETIHSFSAEDLVIGKKWGYVPWNDIHEFTKGSEYHEDDLLEIFEGVVPDVFVAVPVVTSAIAIMLATAEKKGEHYTADVIRRFINSMQEGYDDAIGIVLIKKKIAEMTKAMKYHDHQSLEHGLMWSNRVTFEELLRRVERELADGS